MIIVGGTIYTKPIIIYPAMKQAIINHQIHPALEREMPWRSGEPRIRSRREKFQAIGVYLIRLLVIAALLLAVLNASARNG